MEKPISTIRPGMSMQRRTTVRRLRARTQTQVGISGLCGVICNNGTPAQREWCYKQNNCK